MATAFQRKGSRIVGTLAPQEREVIVGLLGQVRELLGGDEVAPTGDPLTDLIGELEPAPEPGPAQDRDPALDRLLPSGHEDAEEAAEFRSMTERSLRQRKVARIDTTIDTLRAVQREKLELDFGQAQEFMVALTDARLVLADRLDLHTEEDAERLHHQTTRFLEGGADFSDVDETLALFYDFLTWLQESLANALMTTGGRRRSR
ncbi:DUF2017 domain-containing protein [Branchiibius sp. NY16-3462-2]|uniref:DUF2017 domain-containing protein n=1 Tax=Branchiibius sp. NY16-3462-2 TaxID=1807500 RepID=UPI0007981AC8|nr:DUF2017 domain-containing protein [Branchiibius sp. NY16-3462-2]KYH43330.1 hypothetical protein AZH51_13390 [Branchiibius sp. NY16-3462-2]